MDELLESEYKQWLFITRDLYKYFNEICSLKSPQEKQEGTNVLQHWLLVINEDKYAAKYANYPLLSKCTIDDEIAQKLVGAVIEKNFFWRKGKSKSEEAVEKLLDYIAESHEKYQSTVVDFEPSIEDKLIRFGEFSCQDFKNLSYLLANFSLVAVTTMLLRYESLGNGSYQWGDPLELHMSYYNDHHVRYEGFASPINSRFITLPSGKYCSLFPDIDSQFGSMGDFFDINLIEFPGGWCINPPFVNSILEKTSKKMIAALKAGTKSTYFCTYPMWYDCQGCILLEKSQFLIKKFIRKNGCCIEDAFGNLIHPPIGLSLFCLSYSKDIDLNSIEDFINKPLIA